MEVYKRYKDTYYFVSDLGNVKGYGGYVLKPSSCGCNYLYISLRINGETIKSYIHHLVWETFRGGERGNMYIDHKDENKFNNALVNLQLLTPRMNTIKGYYMKRRKNSSYKGFHSRYYNTANRSYDNPF